MNRKEVKAEWLHQRLRKKRAKEVEIYYRGGENTLVNRLVSQHKKYDDESKETNSVSFKLNKNESEITIKYFSMSYPIIDALNNGKRIIVDELEIPYSLRY